MPRPFRNRYNALLNVPLQRLADRRPSPNRPVRTTGLVIRRAASWRLGNVQTEFYAPPREEGPSRSQAVKPGEAGPCPDLEMVLNWNLRLETRADHDRADRGWKSCGDAP